MSVPSLSDELQRAENRHCRALLEAARELESRGMSSEALWKEFSAFRRYRQFARHGLRRNPELSSWAHDNGRNPTAPG